MRTSAVGGLLVACVACGDNKDVDAVPLVSGAAQLVVDGDTLTFSREGATLLAFGRGAFVVGTVDDLDSGASHDPYWLFKDSPPEPPEGLAWHASGELRVASSDMSALSLRFGIPGGDATATFTPTGDGNFRLVFASDVENVAFLRVRADADRNEGFYGLGEWPDGIMHRGKLRPMQLEVDASIEGTSTENHVPVPLLIGTRGWGVFAKTDRAGTFDVARETDTLVDITFGTAEASDDGLELHLFSAPSPLDILKPYFDVTGYPALPALWTYGPLIWRDEHASQAQVLDDIQQIRSRDLATSGIWFDRPYARGVNTFDWNPAKFPDPRTMFQALHDAGLRYGIWQAPYTAPASNQDPAPDTNAYAAASGFFPPVTGLLVNPWSKPIDFTNPDAYAWWQEQLATYTKPLSDGGWGVEGFKLDYGEDVVAGASGSRIPWVFADGSDERTMHYRYTLLYHQIHRQLLDANGTFMLTRAGRWGSQALGLIIWPGDLDADLSRFGDPLPGTSLRAVGGLPTSLNFGLGLSASGFPFYASDTGGYRHAPPNNETWLRWVEANTVWPAMQVGDSSSEAPWELTPANGRNAQSVEIYRRYARLHMRLFPYAWSYAEAMSTTGRSIARPIGLAYPTLGVHPNDQYMFGEYMLSAPVITKGQTARDVWFPPGGWLDWWTGEPRDGGVAGTTASVPAPLDTLPLYIARGGIVPMLRETIDTLSPTTMADVESYANDPGMLVVRVAPGAAPTSFTVFDGGALAQDANATKLSFMPGTKFKAGVLFEVIATDEPATVTDMALGALTKRASRAALDAATSGWYHDAAATGGTLWIKSPGAAALAIQY